MKKRKDELSDLKRKIEKNLNLISKGKSPDLKSLSKLLREVNELQIDPSLMTEEKEMLEDLLAAAVNDCVRKVETENQKIMGDLTGGMQMPPGFKMPF